MRTWRQTALTYRDPKVLSIVFLGFSSGLPFLLTLATLHVWLLDVGMTKTAVGIFAAVTLPYSLKFLWAPFIDLVRIPFFCTFFGQRKGWMLVSQLLLAGALLLLGATNPAENPFVTAMAALLVACCSATQDIVVEAYRIEAVKGHLAGPGAGASSFGYRLGMWVSGAGALYLAAHSTWFAVYAVMAGFVLVGIITTLLSSEPTHGGRHHKIVILKDVRPALKKASPSLGSAINRFKTLFHMPLKTLFSQDLMPVLGFIFLYKIGDTILNTMTIPFLLEIGFSKIEIANVAKSFGIAAAIFGSLIGGILLSKIPLISNLVLCASLQVLSSLMFMLQARFGHNLPWLFLSIGVENFACGMGTAAYLVYLSSKCLHPFTASHFALLCSFGSLCRVGLSALAGWGADRLLWEDFYLIAALLCVPCLFLLALLPKEFQYVEQETTTEKVA